MKKLSEKICKSCLGKRYYTLLFGIHGAADFGNDGFIIPPKVQLIPCPICNKGNKRRIKGVQKGVFIF